MITLPAARFLPALAAMVALVLTAGALFAQSAGVLPAPTTYVTDRAGVLSPSTIDTVDSQLDQFEKQTSNQIVVALIPTLPDNAGDIDQYAISTYNAWKIGQKAQNNGALLLVAVNDHKMFICTGRGLEGALPDAICASIVNDVIAPRFKAGDYDGGIENGVQAMIAATQGEYKGNGSTVERRKQAAIDKRNEFIGIIIFLILMFIFSRFGSSGMIYTGGGWGGGGWGGGGFGGGGGWGGGGGGGGFSGGGGGSAGGGAGGSW